MRNTTRLLDVLDRMENGPIIEEEDYDMNLVSGTMAKLQEKYDIVIPPDAPLVNEDDKFADRLFEAGLEMAEIIGVFNQDTSRRALWTRDEILTGIGLAPSELTMGDFPDRHTIKKRFPEDEQFITIKGGAVGTPMPEELYLPLHQSYAQEPLVDMMINATLETIYGRVGRSHSPYEVLMAWHELELVKGAVKRAGRPGIPLGCVENAVTEIGELSAGEAFGQHHWHHVAMVSEFKTNYSLMIKIAHLVRTESIIHSFYNTIYGGTAGGREGMAIAIVGGNILLQMAYMTTTHSVSPAHPFYGNTTSPDLLRAISPAQQALSRNTHLLTDVAITPVGGPGTKTLLYEVAAQTILVVSSGSCGLIGPRSAADIEPGHVSGLEARFMGEVAHASAGMSRGEANRIVTELVSRYEDQIGKRPIGKPFNEVYDLDTLQPKSEWLDTYNEVKKELADLGLKIDTAAIYKQLGINSSR